MAQRILKNRDNNGYITNTGLSKYWGVSIASYGDLMVSFQALDLKKTISLHTVEFKITEEDAARVAAVVYEAGQMYQTLPYGYIRSVCGNYVFTIDRAERSIKRSFYKNQQCLNDKWHNLKDLKPITDNGQELLIEILKKIELTQAQKLEIIKIVSSK